MSDEKESQLVISLRNYLNLNDVAWDKPYRKNLENFFTASGWENVQVAYTELSEKEIINETKIARFEDMKKELFPKQDTPASNNENNSETKTGGTTMAEENNTPTTEEPIFEATKNQKAACDILGLNVNDYKSNESIVAAIQEASAGKGYEFKDGKLIFPGGATVSVTDEQDTKPTEEKGKQPPAKEEDVAKDGTEKENKDAKKPLGIDGEGNDSPTPATQNTNEEAPEIADWIKKKIQDYQDMADGKIEGCPKLGGYRHDESIKDGFAADFNGGHIHYTSPDNVIVSKESGLIVFETLVTEPDNRGRPVNFGSNLDHEQAVKLLAACLLHDNPIGENAPQLSEADLKLIEAELKDRPDDLAAFKEKAQAYTKSQQQNTAANEGEQPQPIEKAFDDETKKQVKEALEHQYKLSALEAKGVVEKDDNKKIVFGDDGNPKKSALADQKDYDEYIELRNKTIKVDDKEIGEKEFLAQKFVENPGEVRELVNTIVNDMHKEKINALRDKMAKTAVGDSNQLAEHDKKILALSGRLNDTDKAFITKKGEKQEVKALEGEAKERFESRNKDAIAKAMENYKSNTK